MHDTDRTVNEFGMGSGEMQAGEIPFEFEFESMPEMEFAGEVASPFNEMQEMELATELLSVSNEAELNYFLGNLIKKAGSAVGSFISSPIGKSLGGILKTAAKKALPVVGGAIGGYFGGPTGAKIGSGLASTAGRLFGLELEALNPEDREFEMARRFVRFGGASTVKALKTPKHVAPHIAARTAVASAARQYMPGLLVPPQVQVVQQPVGLFSEPVPIGARSGRWIRRGRKIILLGV